MSFLPFVDIGLKIIDKVIPDPKAKDEARYKLLELQQANGLAFLEAEVKQAEGQMQINKAEAESGNAFASSWRPLVGYVCVLAMASNYIGVPMLAWLSPWIGLPPPPRLDIGELLPILLGMLGLGAMRTTERIKGVIPNGK